jgi:glycosyltransferase involved in cell wall biosynthesis
LDKKQNEGAIAETNLSDSLNIVQVNSTDTGGGAARVAVSLHDAYRKIGHHSWLVVGHKLGSDKDTLPIRHDLAATWWQSPFWRAENEVAYSRFRSLRWLRYALLMASEPQRFSDWYQGREDFYFPGTSRLLDLPGAAIDILHLHNLHGRYFDLRRLPELSAAVPTLLSLHDAWLMSGHCAHSLNCERWREGCGHCPDLTLYPAILRDATAENWRRKREIYARSRYHIVAPCQWIADKAAASPLQAGMLDMRVIHHGVDLSCFKPGDRAEARHALGLSQKSQIVLMVANHIRRSPWKGFLAAHAAFEQLSAQNRQKPLLVLVVGDSPAEEHLGDVTIRYLPYVTDRSDLARYYQAADLFLNASTAETFNLTIIEALACGLPVVATAVGGTPEEINSWPGAGEKDANGILVPAGDSSAMALAIAQLLDDEPLRHTLGQNGARRAASEFDFNLQAAKYLDYYREIIT